jgi:hypothetical protein
MDFFFFFWMFLAIEYRFLLFVSDVFPESSRSNISFARLILSLLKVESLSPIFFKMLSLFFIIEVTNSTAVGMNSIFCKQISKYLEINISIISSVLDFGILRCSCRYIQSSPRFACKYLITVYKFARPFQISFPLAYRMIPHHSSSSYCLVFEKMLFKVFTSFPKG